MTDANQEYTLGGFGARLKTAREAMNLSQKDAALRLHLNPNILQILETENFQKAPPATFMRGYLRSYARMLDFNEEDINAALTQSGLEPEPRSLVIPTLREEMPMSDPHVQRISTYVVLGLFIFVGIWWGFHSSSNNNTTARSTQLAAPSVPKQPAIAQPATVTQPVATAATAPPSSVAAPATVQPVAPVAPQPTVASAPASGTPVVSTAPTTTVIAPSAPPAAQAPVTTPPGSTAPNVANTTNTTGTLATTPPAAPAEVPLATATAAPPAATTTTPPVTIPYRAPNTTVASSDNSDTPKKQHTRHHQQHGTVSGFSMALPEPGL